MKKSLALVMSVILVLFCFAGCNKYKEAADVEAADGQSHHMVTEKGGELATDENGNFYEAYTDDAGKKQTQAVELNTALVYGNKIYFTDYNITLPDGWSNNEDNSSYTQANIVDPDGNLITIRESDRSASDVLSTANLIVNAAKSKYEDTTVTTDTVKIGDQECQLRSFYIASGAPEGTNPYTAYIVIDHENIILDVQIESGNDLTGKLDSIIDVLSTIKYNNVATTTAADTTAATIAATTTK